MIYILRGFKRWFRLISLSLIALVPLIVAIDCKMNSAQEIPPRISGLNYTNILTASRVMISNFHTYQNDWHGRVQAPKNAKVLDPEVRSWGPEIPDAIRGLHPIYLMIYEDRMLIYLEVFPKRLVLFAFAAQVQKQSGSIRLINGLWFFDGNRLNQNSEDKMIVDR